MAATPDTGEAHLLRSGGELIGAVSHVFVAAVTMGSLLFGLLDGPWHAQASDYCGLPCTHDDDCGPWNRCVPGVAPHNHTAPPGGYKACHFCPWEDQASCSIVHCQPPSFMSQYTVLISIAATAALVHHTWQLHLAQRRTPEGPQPSGGQRLGWSATTFCWEGGRG